MAPNFLLLTLAQLVLLAGLILVLFRTGRFSRRAVVWSVLALVVLEAGFVVWVAADLFHRWNDNPACAPCQLRLPPHSDYWYQESFYRWGAFFGVNAAAGLLFGFGFWLFARFTKGRVIDRDDVFLLTLAGMMTGWPNILLFLASLFVLGIGVWIAKRLFLNRDGNPQVVVTPLIPFAAAPILIWGDWLAVRLLNIYDIGLVATTLVKP